MSKKIKMTRIATAIENKLNTTTDKFTATVEPGIAIIEFQIDEKVHTNAMVFYTEPDWRKTLDVDQISNQIITEAINKFNTQKSASYYTDAAREHAALAMNAALAR